MLPLSRLLAGDRSPGQMIVLLTDQDLLAFEREIGALIERSELSRAEKRVKEAIGHAGSDALMAASDIPGGSVQIEGWRMLCADLVKADDDLHKAHGARLTLLELGLENAPSIPRLQLTRKFHTGFERYENGYVRPDGHRFYADDRPVYVSGLEALMAAQRVPWPSFWDAESGVRRQFSVDHLLAGLLLVIKVHRVFDDTVAARGLPLPVNVILDTLPSRPYPLDYDDLGPHTRRFVAAQDIAVAPNSSAAELLSECQAEDACACQAELNDLVAWTREIFRLPRMFPFYRFVQRHRTGQMVTHHLTLICLALNMKVESVSWRMKKADFEGLLRRLVEAKNPPSVEDALDVRHVNALHKKWLQIATTHKFEIPVEGANLFELTLAHALRFGGPITQWRWETAKDYHQNAR